MKWGYFRNRFFLTLVSLGLIVRLGLAFLPGLTFDMGYWVNWSQRLQEASFLNFYTSDQRTDYMPGYLYVLYLLGNVKSLFHLDNTTYLYLLKLPGILADLVLSSVVYLVLLKFKNLKSARLGLVMICLNPALIFNSAVWGQIDGLLTLFMLLTIFTIILSKQVLAAFFLGLSILIKPQALLTIPALSLYFVRNFPIYRLLEIFPLAILIVVLFSIPFYGVNILPGLASYFQSISGQYPYNSLSAYNLWGILGFWIDDSKQIFDMTYQFWGIFLYFLFWVIVIFTYARKNIDLFSLSTLASLSFYFLPTRVHERYLYPAIVFLIISSLILKNRLLLSLSIILSLIHFINLLHVYLKYDGYLLSFQNFVNPLYYFLEGNIKLISLISSALFVFIAIILLKEKYRVEETS